AEKAESGELRAESRRENNGFRLWQNMLATTPGLAPNDRMHPCVGVPRDDDSNAGKQRYHPAAGDSRQYCGNCQIS
ncbi:MAG: hypothetical protein KDA96_25425, partial [Planctomycetaceae bacterium]|nr:hypothetical protein [Planctomycetaceae bacterium]